jgi:hypothetical protein
MALIASWPSLQAAWSQEAPAAVGGTEEPEVLTRGPIHEAFAEPVTDPEPGIIVPKKPPPDIDEVPPEYAPDIEGAIWIKGYWAWDDEKKDFIWISGVHRVPPPGMRWVPGFWNEVAGGWQWNRGFWIKADAKELAYRPPPPASPETGPSSPSPGDDYYYVPGHWTYDTDYRWSPGYWAVYDPNWVWIPAHWVWTPRGCIYIPGYCDYRITYRGCLYAPVYFPSAFYARPGYYYRPWCALNLGNLFVHFWVRPNYCHYYFGNYYGIWDTCGLTPWYRWHYFHRRSCYDPILSWCHVHYHRRGINYIDRIGGWHQHYERHEHARPPRTLVEQGNLLARANVTNITEVNQISDVTVKQNVLAAKVDELARLPESPVRLRRLEGAQQEAAKNRARQVGEEIAELRNQRRRIERPADLAAGDKGGKAAVNLPAAPGVEAAAEAGAEAGAKIGAKRGPEVRGKAAADARAAARAEETKTAKLKLPEGKLKSTPPQVTLPEISRRGGGRARAGGDVAAAVEGGKAGDAQGGAGANVRPDRAGASRRTTEEMARDRRPRGKTPTLEPPQVELPDAGGQAAPGDAVPRVSPIPNPAPRGGGAPRDDRPGGKSGRIELPRVPTPVERPMGHLPLPSRGPPVERSDDGPRLNRPAVGKRPGGGLSRVEGGPPASRIELPGVEPRVSPPRGEAPRSEPRVSPPRSEPRIQPHSEPRVVPPWIDLPRPQPQPRVQPSRQPRVELPERPDRQRPEAQPRRPAAWTSATWGRPS